MKTSRRISLFAGIVIASIWTSKPAVLHAQDKTDKPAAAARDSVSIQDVQKAAEQLADAVQAAVRKATEDPAVKVAALKVAKNAVVAAQVVITQQAETMQAVLDTLAREIAVATEKQQSKQKSH
jgi:hypothetical protein